MVSFPDNRNYEYAYKQSYELAVERLANIEDYVSLCRKSDCRFRENGLQKIIELEYLNRMYHINVTGGSPIQITATGSDEEVPHKEQILILHYVLNARGTPLGGQAITFKELPEGPVYFRTFTQRTIKHLVTNFSDNPPKLIEAAEQIGGKKADYGDAAVTIPAFSRVPITFVIWKGDAEFPAEGNVLYNSTITDYLPTEDIIVLSETVLWTLVRAKK